MILESKINLLTWFILLIIAIALVVRNLYYDWIFALLIIIASFIFLILYGYAHNIDYDFTIWSIIFVAILAVIVFQLAVAYYAYTQFYGYYAFIIILAIIYIVVLLTLTYYAYYQPDSYNDYSLTLMVTFFLGLFLPIFFLWCFDINNIILLLTLIFVLVVAAISFVNAHIYYSLLFIGIAILVWFIPYPDLHVDELAHTQ